MNEKINFLKFFFESRKSAAELSGNRNIADFFPALIYIYDVENKTLRYANKKFSDFFGELYQQITKSENALMEIVFEADRNIVKDTLDKVNFLNSDQTFNYICRYNHISESWRYFKTFGTILSKNKDGEAASLLFIAEDVTEEIKSKEEINSLKNLFGEAESFLEFGSWTLDAQKDLMTLTPGLCAILDCSQTEIGDQIKSAFFIDHAVNGFRNSLREQIQSALETGKDFEIEYVIQTRKGKRKTVCTKGKVVSGQNGYNVKILGITRDITAIKNYEKDQERYIRDLNRSNKELEEFAYVASHDLQEPVRKVSMFSERLKSKLLGMSDQETQLFLDRIIASSSGMKDLIDNLLEFSKTSRSLINYQPLELHGILDQAIADLELKIQETRSRIDIDGSLPRIEAVSSEMKQLFTNLLSNALKFKKAEAPADIRISSLKITPEEKRKHLLKAEKTYYKIEVIDHGIGFEHEYTEKIFQIFHRLHGKTEYPGSGIGLAICKKIVDNHNGIIFAQSVPDEGSTFTIILPEKQF